LPTSNFSPNGIGGIEGDLHLQRAGSTDGGVFLLRRKVVGGKKKQILANLKIKPDQIRSLVYFREPVLGVSERGVL